MDWARLAALIGRIADVVARDAVADDRSGNAILFLEEAETRARQENPDRMLKLLRDKARPHFRHMINAVPSNERRRRLVQASGDLDACILEIEGRIFEGIVQNWRW